MGTPLAALRYTLPQIAVHWLSLLLVIAAFATRELAEGLSGGWSRELFEGLHYGFGLSLLLLTALRLVLRALFGAPRHPVVPPALQRWLAGVVHWALYLWLLAMPLSGWALASAEGEAITLFGLPWPGLGFVSERAEHALEDLHEALATTGYLLIGLHAAAALGHHFVLRDGTLARMLPGGRP